MRIAPRSLPRCGAPEGWIPLKIRGRRAASGAGAGAGTVSIVIVGECSGPPEAPGRPTPSATIDRDVTTQPSPPLSAAPLRVALLGAGTVGREVACALIDRRAELRPSDGPGLELVGIAVREPDRAIASGLPADLVTDAPAHLVADAGADVIVELMGGDEPAHTLIAAALSMGTPVVTANKHVIAHHGPALEAIARRTGAALRFEAAVGGGIPILGPLAADLAADRVSRVRGIVNGTSNFILTAMTDPDAPRDYADALAEAQRLGYAEADPSGDVEGLDAVNKLVILARLAFDRWLDPASIATRPDGRGGPAGAGITAVTRDHADEARAAGRVIRLLATAEPPARRQPRRRGPADGAPARLRAGPHGRRPEPRRGGRRAGRLGRLRRPGRGRRRDLLGRARRPHRDRPRRRLDLGSATRRRAARPTTRSAPRRATSSRCATASGTRSMTESRTAAPSPRPDRAVRG